MPPPSEVPALRDAGGRLDCWCDGQALRPGRDARSGPSVLSCPRNGSLSLCCRKFGTGFVNKLDESLLTKLPPFSRLDRPQIRTILDQAAPRRYDEGTTVFGEGMAAERFYLLLDGTIRVVRTTPTGEQIIALHIGPGQLFGIAPARSRRAGPARYGAR